MLSQRMQNKNADIAVCRECDEKLSSRLAVIFKMPFSSASLAYRVAIKTAHCKISQAHRPQPRIEAVRRVKVTGIFWSGEYFSIYGVWHHPANAPAISLHRDAISCREHPLSGMHPDRQARRKQSTGGRRSAYCVFWVCGF